MEPIELLEPMERLLEPLELLDPRNIMIAFEVLALNMKEEMLTELALWLASCDYSARCLHSS